MQVINNVHLHHSGGYLLFQVLKCRIYLFLELFAVQIRLSILGLWNFACRANLQIFPGVQNAIAGIFSLMRDTSLYYSEFV